MRVRKQCTLQTYLLWNIYQQEILKGLCSFSRRNFVKILMIMAMAITTLGAKASDQSFKILSGDCHIGIDKLTTEVNYYSGALYWIRGGAYLHEPLTKVSDNELSFHDEDEQLRVDVKVIDTKVAIRLAAYGKYMETTKVLRLKESSIPGVLSGENISLEIKLDEFPSSIDDSSKMYSLSCSLGLKNIVNKLRLKKDQQMDRLGPPANWEDETAQSIKELPVGTIFEIKEDLTIDQYAENTKFVEMNGQMSFSEFYQIKLPFRFAVVDISNEMNNYTSTVTYKKGSRIKLNEIKAVEKSNGAVEYLLNFDNLSSEVKDPITQMRVYGRRGGRSDMKIPQLVEILKTNFNIILK